MQLSPQARLRMTEGTRKNFTRWFSVAMALLLLIAFLGWLFGDITQEFRGTLIQGNGEERYANIQFRYRRLDMFFSQLRRDRSRDPLAPTGKYRLRGEVRAQFEDDPTLHSYPFISDPSEPRGFVFGFYTDESPWGYISAWTWHFHNYTSADIYFDNLFETKNLAILVDKVSYQVYSLPMNQAVALLINGHRIAEKAYNIAQGVVFPEETFPIIMGLFLQTKRPAREAGLFRF